MNVSEIQEEIDRRVAAAQKMEEGKSDPVEKAGLRDAQIALLDLSLWIHIRQTNDPATPK